MELAASYDPSLSLKVYGRELSRPEIGCALSHLRVYQRILLGLDETSKGQQLLIENPGGGPNEDLNGLVKKLGLKIDVDTREGLEKGAPSILNVLAPRGIKASFYVALGPDNSGRAIFRAFRQKGFLEKMLRTRAPVMYGIRTMLYGTVLPAPSIAAAAQNILPEVAAAGHEIGVHGFDHVRWHDRLLAMGYEEVSREVGRAQEAIGGILGHPARAFAAPGWQASALSRSVLAQAGFRYASDTRGYAPYWPRFGDKGSDLLEIPTTLPTLDELLGFDGLNAEGFFELLLSRLNGDRPQVLTAHPEVEGGPYLNDFARFLDNCLEAGVEFFRLGDWAEELLARPEAIPAAQVYQGRLPGRAGRVSRQGPLEVRP
jgi:undecaprenyl phosphate-alpha-L-ara4FN deformylase